MPRGQRRYWLLRTASAASLCVALCGSPALAQQKYNFDFPQQPLSAALKDMPGFRAQQIIFTEDIVWGYVSKPLHGAFSAPDALTQLLGRHGPLRGADGPGCGDDPAPRTPGEQPQPVQADPPPDDEATERITVTGLIHSLRTNLDIKRNAPGLVDAIAAEDIGKFPDTDIAAAMQRIPGVTVSRGVSSLGGVPTSTGTATQITVRGFGPSFNETLFNSRKVSSGIGRAFDFSSIGADFVSEIDVLKSPDAALSSGAIGATVDIKFPRPLDHPGQEIVGSVSGTISPEEGNVTPEYRTPYSATPSQATQSAFCWTGPMPPAAPAPIM